MIVGLDLPLCAFLLMVCLAQRLVILCTDLLIPSSLVPVPVWTDINLKQLLRIPITNCCMTLTSLLISGSLQLMHDAQTWCLLIRMKSVLTSLTLLVLWIEM